MDEQGAEGPEEEGQGKWGDMHVQGGPSPSPPLTFLVLQQPLIIFDLFYSVVLLVLS